MKHLNIVITTDDSDNVLSAGLATGVWISDNEATELCESDLDAAQGIIDYAAAGVAVSEHDLTVARQIAGE